MPTRTRIVATIGPASESAEAIRGLAHAGAAVFRLNGSHNSMDWHERVVARIRAAAPAHPILLDIPGRKIRTGDLDRPLTFAAGDIVRFAPATAARGGAVVVNSDRLAGICRVGGPILADDGTLRFVVVEVDGEVVAARAAFGGTLHSRKGLNVPGADLGPAALTDRDRAMLEFAGRLGVDYVGISFVESAAHVQLVRAAMCADSSPRVVSKVESAKGFANMSEVIAASDAVMIDRGDLSVETDLEGVTMRQKLIIEEARRSATPVIVATEMLHSMIVAGTPTKAEVSDITNAVLDGCAATMLSGETAIGVDPAAAVSLMNRVIAAAERTNGDDRLTDSLVPGPAGAICRAIAHLVRELHIDKVVAVTRSGYAARVLAGADLRVPIIAVSDRADAARAFGLFPGVTGVHFTGAFSRSDVSHVPAVLEALWRDGRISADEQVLVSALAYPTSGKRMNHLETHHVGDLANALGWSTNR